eukprot:1810183-Amphidinium_carterae.1
MNVELGSLQDEVHIGKVVTHAANEDEVMRAQLLLELFTDFGIVATSTFEGVESTRPEAPTRYHWTLEGRGKTLDYICLRARATLRATRH